MSFRINGLTPTEMGFTTAQLDGWLDGQTSQRGFLARPGPYGGFTSELETVAPRIVRFVGLMTGLTTSTRDAAMDTLMSNLGGLLEVEFDDQDDKVLLARLSSVTTTGIQGTPNFVVGDLRVTIELIAHQAVKIDKYGMVVRVSGSLAAGDGIPVGTAPTLGRIFIANSTNPVFTLYDFRGNAVETMTLTVTLSSSEAVIIDLWSQAIYDLDSEEVLSRNDALLTAGGFFEIKPEYADIANGVWPQLAVSDGEGWFEFRRTWRS